MPHAASIALYLLPLVASLLITVLFRSALSSSNSASSALLAPRDLAPPPQGTTSNTSDSASVPPLSMAWFSSGSTNAALVANMARNGLIKSDRVQKAMLGVDRGHYSPAMPYEDSPQSIGFGATISAPHMHAAACESLLPFLHGEARVLDVGSGSGYLTHVLANLVEPGGKVVGIDHIQGLVDLAAANTAKSDDGRQLVASGRLRYVKGDGRKGFVDDGPYDAIHVGAAAQEAHQELIDQLKAPGRMFIPVGGFSQFIWVIDKKADGAVERRREFGVRYVPLTDAPKE